MTSFIQKNSSIPSDLRKYLPNAETPWKISERVFVTMKPYSESDYNFKKSQVLPEDKEWEFIWRYFYNDKPPRYDIHRIYCVHKLNLTESFELNLKSIEEEAPNQCPNWKEEPREDQRKEVMERWKKIANIFSTFTPIKNINKEMQRTKIFPLWHGTKKNTCSSICTSGFSYFGKTSIGERKAEDCESTDVGYFGSGIYFTTSARYAQMFSEGHLLLAWVSMREPFPVVGDEQQKDMTNLMGKGHYKNYNAHYIPVKQKYPDPDCDIYYPCDKGDIPTCDEIVVFQKSQTLPRFWIELAISLPNLRSLPNTPKNIKDLLSHFFELLQIPAVNDDYELLNFLKKELQQLLIKQDEETLTKDNIALYYKLTRLIDGSKVNTTARKEVLSIQSTFQHLKSTSESNSLLSEANLFIDFNKELNAESRYNIIMYANHLNYSSISTEGSEKDEAAPNIGLLGAAFTKHGLLIDSLHNIQALAAANILRGMYNYYELLNKLSTWNNEIFSSSSSEYQIEINSFIKQINKEIDIIKKTTTYEIETLINLAYNSLETFDSIFISFQKQRILYNCNTWLYKAALLIAYKIALNPQDDKINKLHDKLNLLYTFVKKKYDKLYPQESWLTTKNNDAISRILKNELFLHAITQVGLPMLFNLDKVHIITILVVGILLGLTCPFASKLLLNMPDNLKSHFSLLILPSIFFAIYYITVIPNLDEKALPMGLFLLALTVLIRYKFSSITINSILSAGKANYVFKLQNNNTNNISAIFKHLIDEGSKIKKENLKAQKMKIETLKNMHWSDPAVIEFMEEISACYTGTDYDKALAKARFLNQTGWDPRAVFWVRSQTFLQNLANYGIFKDKQQRNSFENIVDDLISYYNQSEKKFNNANPHYQTTNRESINHGISKKTILFEEAVNLKSFFENFKFHKHMKDFSESFRAFKDNGLNKYQDEKSNVNMMRSLYKRRVGAELPNEAEANIRKTYQRNF